MMPRRTAAAKKLSRVVLAALFLALTLGFGGRWIGTAAAQERQAITLGMSWLWTGRHAWYFSALERGLYAKAGIDATIIRGYGGGTTAKNLAVNSIQFADLDVATLIKARAEGLAVKQISVHFQKSPFALFALFALRKSNIKSPKDIEGKTLGAPKFDVMRIFFPAYAKLAGFDADRTKWVTFSPGNETPSLLAGKVDVTTGFIDTFWAALKTRGVDAVMFPYSDVGFKLYGSGIATADAQIEQRPDLVRKFTIATNRAVAWTAKHPDEAIANIRKHHPTLDQELLKAQLTLAIQLLGDTSQVGRMNDRTMAESKRVVYSSMNITKEVPLNQFYTNEFLE